MTSCDLTHVVIKLLDNSFVLSEFFKVDKISLTWRTTEPSKWPKEEIEFLNHRSVLVKGFIQFIGTEDDAEKFLLDCSTINTVAISPAEELLEIKAELVKVSTELSDQKSQLTDLKKKFNDVLFEMNKLKNDFCPPAPSAFRTIGTNYIQTVTMGQLVSTFDESTDLKGFCVLVISQLGFTTEQRHDEGKTCLSKLDKVEQEKITDLIDLFVEEKQIHEKAHPKVPKPKRKSKQTQSNLVAACSSGCGETENNGLEPVPIESTVELTVKMKRKREEPIDESTLSFDERKKALKAQFSKKLGNKNTQKKAKSN